MKYYDKEWLETKYWEENLTTDEMGDLCNVDRSTINRWMKKNQVSHKFYEWVSPERLEDLYYNQLISLRKIGEKFGVGKKQVAKAMEKHGFESMSQTERGMRQCLKIQIKPSGYYYFRDGMGERTDQLLVHRLVAVAEYGVDALEGMYVHHKNEFKLDNRPENLELMTPSEHMNHHHHDT